MILMRVLQVLLGLILTIALGSTVLAGNTKLPLFPTSLFPQGFTAKTTGGLQRQQVTNMSNPSALSPMRVFQSQVQQVDPNLPIAVLGKNIFFDTTLSNPAGQSCASCHNPETGFSGPNSKVNLISGPVAGAVKGRFGNRLVPSAAYTIFSPPGPFFDPTFSAYTGGQFWDGRARNTTIQSSFPFQNPNEMNNIVHNIVDPELVVVHIAEGPYADLYQKVFGADIFNKSPAVNLQCIGQAITAYERTPEVIPFSSKYDYFNAGRAAMTASELRGLQLFTGTVTGRPGGPPNYKSANCVLCHGIPAAGEFGPDIFSNFCYSNIGVPRNPNNPFYTMTNGGTNPLGYNPLGTNYVDYGLGDFLYPAAGMPAGNNGNDVLSINGTFKAPSLRNVDKRPAPNFVKAYMHNGFFKSLKDVVHFYNTRNLTTVPGEVIDFTQPDPYAGLVGTPLWPQPEYIGGPGGDLQNPSGAPGSPAAQVGNLGLTPSEEADLVAFLKTLSDGYTPRPTK